MNSRAGDCRKVTSQKKVISAGDAAAENEGVQPLKTTGFPRVVSNEAANNVKLQRARRQVFSDAVCALQSSADFFVSGKAGRCWSFLKRIFACFLQAF